MNRVLNGAFKGWGIRSIITGKLVIQRWQKKQFIDSTTVKTYEIIDKEVKKSSLGKTMGMGFLFGIPGAMVGASSKKQNTTIKITWKDDQKSIIELDSPTFKIFLSNSPME